MRNENENENDNDNENKQKKILLITYKNELSLVQQTRNLTKSKRKIQ